MALKNKCCFIGDIGNSSLKLCAFKTPLSGEIFKSYYGRSPGKTIKQGLAWLLKRSADKVLLISVNRPVAQLFKTVLTRHRIPVLTPNRNRPLDINIKYHLPSLGLDRLANIVAARRLYRSENIIVLDFGTAITIDVIESQSFLGGFIMPGLNALLSILSGKTDLLPEVALRNSPLKIARHTESAIQSGTAFQLQGGVTAAVQFIRRTRKKRFLLVGTGGDAGLADTLPFRVIRNDLLTFIGIREMV
jgi:pantothenate kinase type III